MRSLPRGRWYGKARGEDSQPGWRRCQKEVGCRSHWRHLRNSEAPGAGKGSVGGRREGDRYLHPYAAEVSVSNEWLFHSYVSRRPQTTGSDCTRRKGRYEDVRLNSAVGAENPPIRSLSDGFFPPFPSHGEQLTRVWRHKSPDPDFNF